MSLFSNGGAVLRALGLCVLMAFCSTFALAEDSPCKSKSGNVHVAYPDLAKRMKIAGSVRLQLQLDKSGSVREVKVLGGNPVLVTAAQEAVKSTKFENSEPCVISFEFKE